MRFYFIGEKLETRKKKQNFGELDAVQPNPLEPLLQTVRRHLIQHVIFLQGVTKIESQTEIRVSFNED